MNIVLASVDCARPDAFTHRFYEYSKARGTYFDTCIPQAALTSPSHTSILSGLTPINHGVRYLVNYETDATTLPEILSEAGYNTAAFVGGLPLPTGNLDQKFDTFEYVDSADDQREGRKTFGPANLLVNRAINWLDEHDDEDNFVFLHCFDLHFTLQADFGGRDPPSLDEQNRYENVEQYIGRQQRRYYDEADFVARQLELLHELVDIDVSVLTGDHGSKMPGEHGYPWVYNHRDERVGTQFRAVELYDTVIRVPLIFAGEAVPDRTVHEQVRSIDIVPTLLDILEIPCPDVDGDSLLQGDYPAFAYTETYHGQLCAANAFAARMAERTEFGWDDLDSLVSIRSNEWKLICTANGELVPRELYHIALDPGEDRNVIDSHETIVDEYLDRLKNEIEDDTQRFAAANAVDEETYLQLEDLGYF